MGLKWADHYTLKARSDGYRARSVYKLEEIQKRFRVLRPSDKVLDLGCYPGSWSQFALEMVAKNGRVYGVDLKPPEKIVDERFRFMVADVMELEPERLVAWAGEVDVVLSDLAPFTTGVHVVDCTRSMELSKRAIHLARGVLKDGGHLVFKVFESQEVRGLHQELKGLFRHVRALRPKATRAKSREVYTICLNYHKN
jgi:23S rRNA (uridine2552-2'-O)-methyltransferase